MVCLVGGEIGRIEKKWDKIGEKMSNGCVWLGDERDRENSGTQQFSLWLTKIQSP